MLLLTKHLISQPISQYINNLVKSGLKKAGSPSYLLTASLVGTMIVTSGCQTLKTDDTIQDDQVILPSVLPKFNIRGKIGVTTPQTKSASAQSGTAFYVWAQDDNRFAIDITGALGIGHTIIEYNGSTATLVSEKTGSISADSPEELLYKATGWSAPISQLPYWISGRPAPSDSANTKDDIGRLQTATNNNWNASFSYNAQEALPNKIKVQRNDNYKVVMTIAHIKP